MLERLEKELSELNDKRIKLSFFIDSNGFKELSSEEKDLINSQLDSMSEYSYLLSERIELHR